MAPARANSLLSAARHQAPSGAVSNRALAASSSSYEKLVGTCGHSADRLVTHGRGNNATVWPLQSTDARLRVLRVLTCAMTTPKRREETSASVFIALCTFSGVGGSSKSIS